MPFVADLSGVKLVLSINDRQKLGMYHLANRFVCAPVLRKQSED